MRKPVLVLGVIGLLFAAGLTIVFAPVVRAQQTTPQAPGQPVFRGGTTFVSVDVYPRRDGEIIEGLSAADFEVLEDGVPQAIESFQFIRIDPSPPDEQRRDPNTIADSLRQAADPRNRIFVVYLDLAHTTVAGSHYARQPMLEFLNRTIGATDLFGVMTAEVPVSQLVFARRTETLASELSRYWPWGQARRLAVDVRTPQEQRLFACDDPSLGLNFVESVLIPLWREDQLMTSLEHLVLRLGDLRDERKNVLFISEGWIPRGPRTGLASTTRGSVPQVGVGPGGKLGVGGTMQPFGEDRAWCDAEIARLASIDFAERFRYLLTSANRANVSFYPIDVGGLRTSRTRATDTLLTLADGTDGLAITSTNDLTGGARRISDDLSAFYLLGYYSTNTAANGRFRSIEVKVKQPDVQVSARRGYLAATAEMVAAAAAASEDTGPSAVDEVLGRLASVRPDAEMFANATATPDGLLVAVELTAAVARREAWREGGTIEAVASRADGTNASTTMTLEAGARYATAMIDASEVGPGAWQVVVQAAGDEERLEARVEVEVPAAQLVGAPVAWRGMPSPRVPLQPLVDARLTRVERLRVEWAVLAHADTHVARLLDRAGNPLGDPLPFTSTTTTPSALTVDLPIASLPEGDYVIELVATRDEVSERRLLAFRVVR